MSETQRLEEENRYLLFLVGQELYGTPLLDVREVVEYQEPKFVPNMASHFAGVINILGAIIGVADLRKKFAQKSEVSRSTAFLVCDTQQGPLAALVDKVEAVASISPSDLEPMPVVSTVSQEYLIGIAKVKDRLVTVIKLQKAMGDESLVKVSA